MRSGSDPFVLQDTTFVKFFRLKKEICWHLIQELEPHDQYRSNIAFTLRFLSVLYFLAHGSYQKCVANNYLLPLSQSSISRYIHHVTSLIIRIKKNEIRFPKTINNKAAVKAGFYEKFGIKGTTGAIDCTHIAIVSPPIRSQATPAHLYMNRKSYYSINVEAICDHNLRFLAINAKFPGSCHDSGIWMTSPVRMHLMQMHNHNQFTWLLGDSGYPLEPWLLTPVAEPSTHKEEHFNTMHIRARNTIERAFGVLKTRFRCLSKHRALHYGHRKVGQIVYTCAILHNILMTYDPNSDEVDAEIENEEINAVAEINDYLEEGRGIRNIYINSL